MRPQLVVEILSDSTAWADEGPKKDVYASAGVLELWLIHPQQRSVAVFCLQENAVRPSTTHRDDFESRIFPGLRIDMERVFKR